MRRYLQKMTGFDLFGHDIGVNYQGSGTYNTYLSAVVSVITLSLIVINLTLLT